MLNAFYQSFVFHSHSVFAKIYRVKKTRVIHNPRHDIGTKSNIWRDGYDATEKNTYIHSVAKVSQRNSFNENLFRRFKIENFWKFRALTSRIRFIQWIYLKIWPHHLHSKFFSTITKKKKNKKRLRIESKAVKNNLFLYPFNLFSSYSQSSIKGQNFRWEENLLFVRWCPEKIFPTDCISEKNTPLALLHGYKRTSTTRVNKNEVDFLNLQAVHAIIEPGLPREDLSKEESLAGYHRRARDPPSHQVSRKPRVHRVTRKKLCTRSKVEKGMARAVAFKSYRLRH